METRKKEDLVKNNSPKKPVAAIRKPKANSHTKQRKAESFMRQKSIVISRPTEGKEIRKKIPQYNTAQGNSRLVLKLSALIAKAKEQEFPPAHS